MRASGSIIWIFLALALTLATRLHAEDELSVIDQLAQQHLAYIYGSEDIHKGGLDCSGFVQIVFHESKGIELPNEADKQLEYCRTHGLAWDSNSGWTPTTLQPGDLIFFAGPDNLPRASLVTHVMIYCGHNTMAGAQGKGKQEDGVHSGVGYYYFRPFTPSGVFGESGERFIGHRRVFAYGRVNKTDDAKPSDLELLVTVPHKKTLSDKMRRIASATGPIHGFNQKPFGISSRVD